MLQINGKTFMNLQEAVQWLLDNNALPFQSSANYVANTEIGLGTIVNPSPAKVRIGSLIFFADSKVSTVTGLTENGFIVSDQYNDLVDDVVYVSNVALNASGHLIVTLSNGVNIDAGLIKQVTGFSINGSQHLIASYNDGSSTDLGAIFSGNITVSGNLTVTGNIDGVIPFEKIKDSAGHNRFIEGDGVPSVISGMNSAYCKWSLSGSHLMCVFAGTLDENAVINDNTVLATFSVPQWVLDKIYPVWASFAIESRNAQFYADDWTTQSLAIVFGKSSTYIFISNIGGNFTADKDRGFRFEFDLLIDNN